MEIYKIRFLWKHILFLSFHCITTTNSFVTMPLMYMKHLQNVNETCAEISFVKSRCNVLNCANMCALSTGCFSFYYSDIAKRCIGCLLQHTLLHSTDNYTHYIPVKGKNGNMCGYFQYNSHYYSFNTGLLTVEEAESKCSSSGGHLVYVETALEHSFLENISALIPGITNKKFWIGAFLDSKNGKWRWGNGIKTADSFEDFGNFQPSGNGKCVVMGYGNGIWDDQPCSNRNKFICEIE